MPIDFSISSPLDTANPNRNGTGTLADLFTAGHNGSLLRRVEFVAVAATTTGVVRLFVFDGTNNRLIREVIVPAVANPGVTVKTWPGQVVFAPPLILNAGWKLRGSTENTETFNVFVYGMHH